MIKLNHFFMKYSEKLKQSNAHNTRIKYVGSQMPTIEAADKVMLTNQ